MKTCKAYNDIENHIRDIFTTPATAIIRINEEEHTDDSGTNTIKTTIQFISGRKTSPTYTILKPAPDISEEDIRLLYNSVIATVSQKHPLRFNLFRLFGWWFIFAGALTAFSICPICGQVGCPVGIGTTGIIAGVLALVKQHGHEAAKTTKKRIISLCSRIQSLKFLNPLRHILRMK